MQGMEVETMLRSDQLLSLDTTTASNSMHSSVYHTRNVRVITKRTEIFVGSPEKSSPTKSSRRRILPPMHRYTNHMKGCMNESIVGADNAESLLEMLSPPEAKMIHWPSGKPKFLPALNIIQQPTKKIETSSSMHDILSLPTIEKNEQREEQEQEQKQREEQVQELQQQHHQKEHSCRSEDQTTSKQGTKTHRVMNAMMSFMGGGRKKIQPTPPPVIMPLLPLNSLKTNDPETAMIMSTKSDIPKPHTSSWLINAKRRAQSITHNLKIGPTPPPNFTPVL